MINAVLLEGFLSKEKLRMALEEIRAIGEYRDGSLCLIISSAEGDALAAVSFVESIKLDTYVHDMIVKIYEANSTAAFIVLALYDHLSFVEMKKDAVLGIHRGEIRLSPTQVSPDGKIDENLATCFRKYDAALVRAIKKTKLAEDEKLVSELYATDWLRLSAEECLKRGIVQRLF